MHTQHTLKSKKRVVKVCNLQATTTLLQSPTSEFQFRVLTFIVCKFEQQSLYGNLTNLCQVIVVQDLTGCVLTDNRNPCVQSAGVVV